MQLTQEEKNKILAATELVENGELAVIKKILEFQDFINENKVIINDITEKATKTISEVKNGSDGAPGKDGIQGPPGKDGTQGPPGRDGRDGVQGPEGPAGRDGIQGPPGKDGTNGSPDTPQEIADKINTLSSAIKPEAIIGWQDLERKVNLPKDFDVRIGVSKTEVKRLIDRVTALESATSSGVTVETPTGTIDDSNTVFTVTATPKWVIVNGVTYFENAGYSIASLTLTLDGPVGTGGFIRSIY